MPNIWKRENHFMALDKRSDNIQFGSRFYIFFGLRNNRKGDWKRENTFWNNLGQPAYTGRVRYERDYKTSRTPLAQTDSSSSKPASRCPSSPPRATVEFHQEKREREIALEKSCIKIEGPRIWISHRILIPSPKVP